MTIIIIANKYKGGSFRIIVGTKEGLETRNIHFFIIILAIAITVVTSMEVRDDNEFEKGWDF